jgi:hypothetical protein
MSAIRRMAQLRRLWTLQQTQGPPPGNPRYIKFMMYAAVLHSLRMTIPRLVKLGEPRIKVGSFEDPCGMSSEALKESTVISETTSPVMTAWCFKG